MVARLGMSFSASSYQDECGVWSGNLFNAMLTRNMRKSSRQYFIARGCNIVTVTVTIPITTPITTTTTTTTTATTATTTTTTTSNNNN